MTADALQITLSTLDALHTQALRDGRARDAHALAAAMALVKAQKPKP